MIVVADSGPLHYLILLNQADLLHRLYGEVILPRAVFDELSATRAPLAVRSWFSEIPSPRTNFGWFRRILEGASVKRSRSRFSWELTCCLMDERAGRAVAHKARLRVTGTLGVLRSAAELGLIDVPSVLALLQETNF